MHGMVILGRWLNSLSVVWWIAVTASCCVPMLQNHSIMKTVTNTEVGELCIVSANTV